MGITVLLADSLPEVRKAEKALMEKALDVDVVGEAEDESTAMELINSLQPQVELTDFSVRSTGRIFAKQVKSQNPRTKVLGVTELRGGYVRNLLKIFGADELLDKKDLETKLITTLRLVARGES
jgi:DNA-binding NarL/FixJ family response regulator